MSDLEGGGFGECGWREDDLGNDGKCQVSFGDPRIFGRLSKWPYRSVKAYVDCSLFIQDYQICSAVLLSVK